MPTIMVPVTTHRPLDYTRERVLQLFEAGIRVKEIAALCHVTPSRIYAMLQRAMVRRERQRAEQAKTATPA